MYKGCSQNRQRRATRIFDARPSAAAYICDDDVLSDVGSLTLEECEAERRTLLLQKSQAENELRAAKSSGAVKASKGLGYRIQSFCSRLAALSEQMKRLRAERRETSFEQAALELLSEEDFRRVRERADELAKASAATRAEQVETA